MSPKLGAEQILTAAELKAMIGQPDSQGWQLTYYGWGIMALSHESEKGATVQARVRVWKGPDGSRYLIGDNDVDRALLNDVDYLLDDEAFQRYVAFFPYLITIIQVIYLWRMSKTSTGKAKLI